MSMIIFVTSQIPVPAQEDDLERERGHRNERHAFARSVPLHAGLGRTGDFQGRLRQLVATERFRQREQGQRVDQRQRRRLQVLC